MRHAGQAKLGFYPTPKIVVEDVIRILDIEPGAKILDPCCGEGEALRLIKTNFSETITYGVELDKARSEIASNQVDHCLNCDAIGEVRITNGVFDLLWENPPYDNDVRDENEKSNRLESKFLENHLKYLKDKGGVLVYIIPLNVLCQVSTRLLKLADLKVLAFPKAEYEVYKQIVIIGRTTKDITSCLLTSNKAYIEKIIAEVPVEDAYNYLETTSSCDVVYKVASSNHELKTFYTSRIDPEESMKLIAYSTINRTFLSFTQTQGITSIRPMAELTEGHLAMLIAAGMMDGLLDANGEKFVVKGFVDKKFKERTEYEKDKSVTIRKTLYKVVINAINLTTKEFVEISA